MELPILHRMKEALPQYHTQTISDPPSSARLSEQPSYLYMLMEEGGLSEDEIVHILNVCNPSNLEEYSEHLFKTMSLLYENKMTTENFVVLEQRYFHLSDQVHQFIQGQDIMSSDAHLIIEKCFDVLVKMSTDQKSFQLASKSIRFLTQLVMSLNYWQIYNLLLWKPAIYQFLRIIHFDINECYNQFLREYSTHVENEELSQRLVTRSKAQSQSQPQSQSQSQPSVEEKEKKVIESSDEEQFMESDSEDHGDDFTFIQEKPKVKKKKKVKKDEKLQAVGQLYLKSSTIDGEITDSKWQTNKSANYDPEVVHECQLPAPDYPNITCLRRFSRKYELIRHQETVHSKKKRLFKCYVCIKQTPNVIPRIFTRHDTLAKHIRVNHKISGREAKAEVQYSKKHAEIVEEGDVTVQVGRRKTKVDYDLRAHLELERARREGVDEEGILRAFRTDDYEIDSLEDDVQMGEV